MPKRTNGKSKNTGGRIVLRTGGVKKKRRPLATSGYEEIIVPAAESSVVKTRRPKMNYSEEGNLTVEHREYWHDISGSTGEFTLETFALNPGLEEVFPWLAQIAGRFEKYRFHKVCVKYACNCSTSTPGFVGLAIDDDVADEDPGNRSELLAMEGAVTGPAWHEMETYMPLRSNRQWRYTRVGDYPTDTDPRTSDAGKIFIANGNQTATSGIGSFWIDYKVELSVPQLHISPPSCAISSAVANKIFGTTASINQIGTAVSVSSEDQLLFKRAGEYLVEIIGTGTSPVFTGDPVVTNGGTVFSVANLSNASYVAASWIVKVFVGTVLNFSGILSSGSLSSTATQFASRKYEL
jgi:hypothetical protein